MAKQHAVRKLELEGDMTWTEVDFKLRLDNGDELRIGGLALTKKDIRMWDGKRVRFTVETMPSRVVPEPIVMEWEGPVPTTVPELMNLGRFQLRKLAEHLGIVRPIHRAGYDRVAVVAFMELSTEEQAKSIAKALKKRKT